MEKELKVKVELTPFQAASIVSYLKSYVYYESESMQACRESIEHFISEVDKQWTQEKLDDAQKERNIQIALGYEP